MIKKIFNGIVWIFLQTISMKLIALISQLVLVWILSPEDFGKIALVNSITIFSNLIQQFGLQDVLIKRGKSFFLWYNLSFTLSVIVLFISLLAAILFGYIGSLFYNDAEIFKLVLVLSLSIPFQVISIVPFAKLNIDLEFRLISLIKIFEFLIINVGIVILALLNFGVYSFVVPVVFASILRMIYLFKHTRLPFVLFDLRRWKYLVFDSFYNFIFSFFSRLSMQIDIIILGLIVSQEVIGYYFIAMSLSTQVISLIGLAFPTVLFPSFMKNSSNIYTNIDNLRKITIYISMIGIPFCLWQFSNAEHLVKLIFPEKWTNSIIYIKILSIGMIFRLISLNWVVSLKIQGKFKEMSKVTFNSFIQNIIIIIPLAYFFGIVGVAVGIGLFYLVNAPYLLRHAFKGFHNQLKSLYFSVLKHLFISFCSFIPIYYLVEFSNLTSIVKLSTNTIIPIITYVILIFLFERKICEEIINKIKLLTVD